MNKKAIALFSGGLDSILAVKIIQEQGIDVIALNYITPVHHSIKNGTSRHKLQVAGGKLGVDIKIIPLKEDFLELVKNPKYGYGKNLNPCIDCRIMLYKKAKELMPELAASFIITGEVLGQRPMSQYRQAMSIIEKESGLEGLILRPLSAKLLPETIPEKQGWVIRDKLLSISGRSRKPQIELARMFGITDYPAPAGGCLLTDKCFALRMRDLIEFNEVTLRNIDLLKVGRHFRVAENIKLVVGRDESENNFLIRQAEETDIIFKTEDYPGPIGLLTGSSADSDALSLSASIVARYSDANGSRIKIACSKRGSVHSLVVEPCAQDFLEEIRV
ncbi:MAG: tRNA 4-thiouridine(8) synthase ThiI [Candidatus Omnitrophota bacterium]